MADREKGKNMRISVAMATYNGARFITEQLDSIRLQSLPVDQVILRDDGSSDQTLEIVREYLIMSFSAIRTISGNRTGWKIW